MGETIKHAESTKDNISEREGLLRDIKNELISLKTKLPSFYTKNGNTIKYNLNLTKQYLTTINSKKYNSPACLMAVQILLESQGYDVGKIDGLNGTNTTRRLEEFQKDHGLTVDGKIGPKTIRALLDGKISNTPNGKENINVNPENFKYYKELREYLGNNICSTYVYGVVSEILAKKGYCFSGKAVSAWDIKDHTYTKNHFNIDTFNQNPKQQIINAPAGTILTARLHGTKARDKGVSHTMISLGNGNYTDLFGPNIRTINFKSDVTFTGKTFSYNGKQYILTDDARLMSPKLSSFPEGSEKTITKNNITLEKFIQHIESTTGADTNYIKFLIAKKNNWSASQLFSNLKKNFPTLTVKIATRDIKDLKIENKEGSNSVAEDFLDSIKDNKSKIMSYYPNTTNREYDEIAKRAIGILYQETKAGDSIKYQGKETIHNSNKVSRKHCFLGLAMLHISNIVQVAEKLYGAIRGNDFSRGYTQIKFNQVFSQEDKTFLKTFNITSENDLTDAKKCGIATMIALLGHYNRILPMKKDPFWINDAKIIKVTFKDGTTESIARGKKIKINNERRARTDAEIKQKIDEWGQKHGGIGKQETIIRPGLKNDNDFFDLLYYSWNKPSELYFGTATPKENNYLAQANTFITNNVTV